MRQEALEELTKDIYAYSAAHEKALVYGDIETFRTDLLTDLDTMRNARDENIEEVDSLRKQAEESKTRIQLLSEKLGNMRDDTQ